MEQNNLPVITQETVLAKINIALTKKQLSVQKLQDEADALAKANGTEYGLAASVWSSDISRAHNFARKLRAGTVWVNTFDMSDVITPFGGFNGSGAGRDKSLHALNNYSALKTTWVDLS